MKKKEVRNGASGITLVALVVTIVVLIILATITVNIALNGGIADKTQKAKVLYENEEEKEQVVLQNVIERMNEIEAKVPVTDNKAELITFTVIDDEGLGVGGTYKAEVGMTWEDWLKSEYTGGKWESFEVYNGSFTDGVTYVIVETKDWDYRLQTKDSRGSARGFEDGSADLTDTPVDGAVYSVKYDPLY